LNYFAKICNNAELLALIKRASGNALLMEFASGNIAFYERTFECMEKQFLGVQCIFFNETLSASVA